MNKTISVILWSLYLIIIVPLMIIILIPSIFILKLFGKNIDFGDG